MPPSPVPSFLLYGENDGNMPPNFGHIETIAARSALHDWEIAPHRHAHSVQALLVSQGHVEFMCDGVVQALAAPCFMAVPVGSVHGFRFRPETSGYVLSVSTTLSARAGDPADPMLHLLTHGGHGAILPVIRERVEWLCAEMLAIQTDWRSPQPLFLALAEALLRSLAADEPEQAGHAPEDERLPRFRQLVELHLREHRDIGWYAAQLSITTKTLTRICRRHIDCTPVELIHARLALEAQRLLCFTNASVVQVSEELGFSDSSYFSRFYQRMTGRRPQMDKMASATRAREIRA